MADTQSIDPAQAAAEAAAKAQAQVQAQNPGAANGFVTQVAQKIAEADNILVALSKDPTVDEMAAAIGLTLFLDGLGKHATAIYSGLTPNALEFLKPGDTFESNTNSLRDFIIALNKEKADHLRYKLDGDYVKVYITPYKTTIDENDLEFSHGDYNVDLVVALNVPTANDLDAALTEHGRIMHDASAVDITTGEPGKFGEIEWSDPKASSVSEMVTQLVLKLQNSETKMTAEEATAFLTGIVAETERFSNERTTPAAMAMASRLMEMGADQQLVATNITIESPVMGAIDGNAPVDATEGNDPTTLDVSHEGSVEAGVPAAVTDSAMVTEPAVKVEPTVVTEPVKMPVVETPAAVEPTTPIATEPIINAKEKVIEPEEGFMPVMETPESVATPEPVAAPAPAPVAPEPVVTPEPVAPTPEMPVSMPEVVTPEPVMPIPAEPTAPVAPAEPEVPAEPEGPKDYGAMIDAALAEGVPPAPEAPEANHLPEMDYTPQETTVETAAQPAVEPVLPMPENNVVLPPPPAPNVDFSQVVPTDANGMPVLPQVQETQPQPVVQPQPVAQPAQPAQPAQNDPAAFRIPGM